MYIKFNYFVDLVNKLSIKRMKWTICDESTSSSGDEDVQPILPSSPSDGKLSTIEESHLENGVDSDSISSTSRYSSFRSESISNVSILTDNELLNDIQERNSVNLFSEINTTSPELFPSCTHHRRYSDGAIEVFRSVREVTRILPGSNEHENRNFSNNSSQVIVSFMKKISGILK